MHALRVGQKIGSLLVERELGSGSFGTVYLARDVVLERSVALKLVTVSEEDDTRDVLDEARLVARLQSPHVVTLYRVAPTATGEAWLFEMEYVDGPPLEDLLAGEGSLDEARVRAIARGLLDALRTAHECGVVHGDVKPGNVLLTRGGRAKLADFGMARLHADRAIDEVGTGRTGGTPLYLAPEVLLGVGSGPPADVWALGVVLYRALTGRFPFPTGSAADLFHAVLNLAPAPFEAGGDPALQRVILACLTKEPERRASAVTLLRMLNDPTVEPVPARAAVPCGRRRELGRLRAALAEALAGRSRGLVLVGDVGAGKSHLLRALCGEAEVEGVRWIELAADAGGLIGRLGERLGAEADTGAEAAFLIGRALRDLAIENPVAVVVENVDEADPDERRLLSDLLGHMQGSRSLLLASATGRGALPSFEEIDVPPLGPADMIDLLERELGQPLEAESAHWLVKQAQGIPLYARELVRELKEGGRLRVGDGEARVTAFDSRLSKRAEDLAARRLAGLTREELEILEAAAVDGVSFDGRAIAAVTGRRSLAVLRVLQRLQSDRGVVVADSEGFRFANAHLRGWVYDRIAPELRRDLHRLLAEHLAGRDAVDAERLGRHWEGAGEPVRARACFARAALEAARRQERHRSVELARKAGIVPGGIDDATALANAELILNLAPKYVSFGRTAEADRLYRTLLDTAERAGDETLYLTALVQCVRSRFLERGREGAQIDELRRATVVLPPGSEGHAMAHYVLGVFARLEGSLAEARRLVRIADESYEEAGLSGHRASTKSQLAILALREGRPAEAEGLYAEAAEIDRQFGRASSAAISEFNRASAAFHGGKLEGALDDLERHMRELLVSGSRDMAAHARVLVATARWALGDSVGATRDCEHALRVVGETGHLPGLVAAHRLQAELAFAAGDLERMARAIDAGAASARRIGDAGHTMLFLGHAARRCAVAGEPDEAARLLAQASDSAGEMTDTQALGVLGLQIAELAVVAQVPDLAAFQDKLPSPDGNCFLEPAAAALAAARSWRDERPELFFRAATALRTRRIGDRRAVLDVLAGLFEGRAQAAIGDERRATECWTKAHAAARGLGHVWLQARALRLLGAPADAPLREVRPLLSERAWAAWR